MAEAQPLPPKPCEACGLTLAPGLLSCPACHRLVHALELKRLAETAAQAKAAGDASAALAAWRQALELLPPDSKQYEKIAAELPELSRLADAGPRPPRERAQAAPAPSTRPAPAHGATSKGRISSVLAALGGVGLLLAKFKFLPIFLFTKAKFLLLGLSKASTLLSAMSFFTASWTAYGWKYAAGLVASIYVHEMGHVAALRRYGVAASAPMFIPGLGALVRMRGTHLLPRENARVGLAGPIWGLGATVAAYAVSWLGGPPIWAAIGQGSAWLNLFNLLPIEPLDGGRGFASLTRPQRALAGLGIAAMLLFTGVSFQALPLLLLCMLAAAVIRLFTPGATTPDPPTLAWYCLLVAALTLLAASPQA